MGVIAVRSMRVWLLIGALVAVVGLLWTVPPPGAVAQGILPTPTLPFFFFEDNDPYLTYGGNWSTVANPSASGGTEHEARTTGAYVTFIFNGRYMKWYSTKGPNRGRARVYLNDTEIDSSPVDLYADDVQPQQVVVWIDSLDESRSHTLRIEVTGERNGSATDSLVGIDAFEVFSAPRHPAPPVLTPTPLPTAVPTQPPLPTATPTPSLQPGAWGIEFRFLPYYAEHDGPRLLGRTIGAQTVLGGNIVQYFEKGRIEDHSGRIQYGLLVDELQPSAGHAPRRRR